MSLVDAFLGEEAPLKSPAASEFIRRTFPSVPLARRPELFSRTAVHVALRTDGARGSGTLDSPYNGATSRGPTAEVSTLHLAPVQDIVSIQREVGPIINRFRVITVTIETAGPHNMLPGDLVTVTGVSPASGFTGDLRISASVTSTKVTYAFQIDEKEATPSPALSNAQCRAWFAIAETRRPHGYLSGDIVQIEGVSGTYAGYYNCLNPVRSATATAFTYRIDHALTPNDLHTPGPPGGGSVTCRKIVYNLDLVLRSLPPRSVVFLGPGIFETRGGRGGNDDIDVPKLQDGQRIIGAGVNVTTLKLIVTEPPLAHLNYMALQPNSYYNSIDTFELADLTVDCNLRAHRFQQPYGVLTKAAAAVWGWHTRMRRVRTVDFGPLSPAAECFTLVLGGSHDHAGQAFDCVMDECITELPHPNTVRETTCMGIMGGGAFVRNRGCAIRNCVVECRYSARRPGTKLQIQEFKEAGVDFPLYTFFIRTFFPHGRFVVASIPTIEAPNDLLFFNVAVTKNGESVTAQVFNGVHQILQVNEAERKIWFTLPQNPYDVNQVYEFNLYTASWATAGSSYHGPGADAGHANVVDRNRVYHVSLGVNHDTGHSFDVTYENNYYSEVHVGTYENLAQPGEFARQRLVERNVIELARGFTVAGAGAQAVSSSAKMDRLAVRDNVVRCARENQDDYAHAITAYGAANAIIERNFIDGVTNRTLPSADFFAIQDANTGRMRTNDNRRLSGIRQSAVDRDRWKNRAELPEDLVDALIVALFRR